MNETSRHLILALACLFIACPKSNEVPKNGVGTACSKDVDCASGLFCQIRLPGGMCTKECTPCPASCSRDCEVGCDSAETEPNKCKKGCVEANQQLCPTGSDCAVVTYTVSEQSFTDTRCLPECDLERPCRTDAPYECVRPQGFEFSVCIPK